MSDRAPMDVPTLPGGLEEEPREFRLAWRGRTLELSEGLSNATVYT